MVIRDSNLAMDISQQILSDITVFNKYAKYQTDKGRRETWAEITQRNMEMHIRKFPSLKKEIKENYQFVFDKKVLPSMRSMQFGGIPIELSNNRIYNCAFGAINDIAIFWEAMFLLLGGTGFGFSVQKHHVSCLPVVQGPTERQRRHLIGDSIEGWADAIKVLIKSYFMGKSDPVFDYRDIREKGSLLVTSGGKAPGPDPLRICINQVRAILNDARGRQLTTVECHDIMCHIADSVLSGGIRRAALISLFSHDDMDMLCCKAPGFDELNPQRHRSNNSVVLKRDIGEEEFFEIWHRVELSGCGEPGIFWTNDLEIGTNPCAEISLNDCQFCNLTEINADNIVDQNDLNKRAQVASFIGTLQAGYTDFHYLRDKWKDVTEKEALIGVGMTGIASGKVLNLDLREAAAHVLDENAIVAEKIGINKAARTTTVKPSGTSSLTLGCSSGIHGWHNDFYIRRVRVGKNEAMYYYMMKHIPELIEDCKYKPHLEAVMSFPQKAPEGAILRTESFRSLLNRVKKFNKHWVRAGHREGENYHNVSCTISLKPNQFGRAGVWMWENRDFYTGIAVIPYDGGTYVQAPFEDCDEETYNRMFTQLGKIDLRKVKEADDNTNLSDQAACAGNACELTL